MGHKLKAGDCVRVVIESRVVRWLDDGRLELATHNLIEPRHSHVRLIEKIADLAYPTTPGSVIRGRSDTALLTRTGWINHLNSVVVDPEPGAWKVIYDAGAE